MENCTKDNGTRSQVKEMGQEFNFGQMDPSMRGCGGKIELVVKEE